MADRPTPAEIDQLADRFGLHPLDLAELRARGSRPKLAVRSGYAAAVLDFPVQLARPRRTGLGQLNLLVGASFVVASHGGDLRPLVHLMDDLTADAERRAEGMSSPDRLAHAIVRALVDASEPAVKGLGSAIDVLMDDEGREVVRQQAQTRRELSALRRALGPDVEVVFAMARTAYTTSDELAPYWELLGDQLQRLVDELDEVSGSLELVVENQSALAARRAEERLGALLLLVSTGLALVLGALTSITLGAELGFGATLVLLVALVVWLRRGGLA